MVDQAPELRAVALGSADMYVAENLPAAGLGQLPRLGLDALAFAAGGTRAYPYFMGTFGGNLCKGKALLDQGANFLA